LLQIVGKDKDFVGCFLRESPGKGNSGVDGCLATLLQARVDDGVPGQPAVLIEGKGKP